VVGDKPVVVSARNLASRTVGEVRLWPGGTVPTARTGSLGPAEGFLRIMMMPLIAKWCCKPRIVQRRTATDRGILSR
jgi:hypothetical protein